MIICKSVHLVVRKHRQQLTKTSVMVHSYFKMYLTMYSIITTLLFSMKKDAQPGTTLKQPLNFRIA